MSAIVQAARRCISYCCQCSEKATPEDQCQYHTFERRPISEIPENQCQSSSVGLNQTSIDLQKLYASLRQKWCDGKSREYGQDYIQKCCLRILQQLVYTPDIVKEMPSYGVSKHPTIDLTTATNKERRDWINRWLMTTEQPQLNENSKDLIACISMICFPD